MGRTDNHSIRVPSDPDVKATNDQLIPVNGFFSLKGSCKILGIQSAGF